MVPSEVYPDVDCSGPVPPNSTIRIHIQPHHILSNIPYDIFLMIAFLCWDRESDDRDPNFPITTSHICRTWRHYALDTGAFWTSLEFCQKNPHRVIMKYKIWLERSKDSPLDIFIGPQPFKGASVKHAKSIMQLIMAHVGHWRSLRVELQPKKIIRLIVDRLRDVSAPMLETLKVSGERWTRPFRPLVSTGLNLAPFVHGEASNLKELLLEGFPYGYFVTRFRTLQVLRLDHPDFFRAGAVENVKSVHHILISLPGLRVLRIGCARPASILSQSPGLRAFGFFGLIRGLRHAQAVPNPPHPPVHHASLQEIYIRGNQPTRNMIMCSLTLPRIRYFLNDFKDELPLGLSCLQHIGLGSFRSLISLRLQGNRNSWGATNDTRDPLNSRNLMHLSSALETLPELRALTFQNVDFENDRYFIKCLGAAKCCPRLQWFTLLQCLGYTMHELRSVVEARRRLKNVDPLVRVTVYEWPPSTSNIHGDDEARDWLGQAVDFRASVTYTVEDPGQNYLRVVEGVQREAVTAPLYEPC